jgi:hypothetical protein
MQGASLQEVKAYSDKDPLKVADVQKYKIIEFRLRSCQPALQEWFH